MRTPLVEKMLKGETEATSGFSGPAVEESWIKGDLDAGIVTAGEVSGMVLSVKSVREVIEEIMS